MANQRQRKEDATHSWFQEHWVGLIIILASVTSLVFVFAGYVLKWDWTGFNAEGESQPAKTLWDWMALFIVPGVLALGAFLLNQAQQKRSDKETEANRKRDEEAAKVQAKLERDSREDNQRESALQGYLDKMSGLLLENNLRGSAEDELRKIARVRTLTVLRGLDGARKGTVLQFLYDSGLIIKGQSIIDLRFANLSEANLGGASLTGVNLDRVNLAHADLVGTNLSGASLDRAYMIEATLGAYMIGALTKNFMEGAYKSKSNLFGDEVEAYLVGADLSGAYMSGANLDKAHMSGVNLSGANLSGANLSGADLRSAKLVGVNLSNADLSGLDKANPGKVTIGGVPIDDSVVKAILSGANLSRSDKANLGRVTIEGVPMDASRVKAILDMVDLSGANLSDADLSGADLSGANLQRAKYNTRTIQEKDAQGNPLTLEPTQWPQGFDPLKAGAICVDC